MSKNNLNSLLSIEELLVVGAKIKIGYEYFKNYSSFFYSGQIIELVEGWFEVDNGLYVDSVSCPAWWNDEDEDFESIYHLFGNDLEDFMDCEVVN